MLSVATKSPNVKFLLPRVLHLVAATPGIPEGDDYVIPTLYAARLERDRHHVGARIKHLDDLEETDKPLIPIRIATSGRLVAHFRIGPESNIKCQAAHRAG